MGSMEVVFGEKIKNSHFLATLLTLLFYIFGM